MEALHLVINLLEKVSVLVAAALVLLMLRPAEVWLGEAGARASVRRRIFLVMLLGGLATWGTFLGFEVEGMQFNIRMVGIIVAGYLGGAWVGLIVGAGAGLLYALQVSSEIAPAVLFASLFNGVAAGFWTRRFGISILSIAIGAFIIQALQHGVLAIIMAAFNWEMMLLHSSRLTLHAAKITANSVGVTLFVGLLSLVRELEVARQEAVESRDDARDARLEALQYQLQPHFLFNLLNTLAYLIRTDPARARELTLDLSEFLRYTLDRSEVETTLKDELHQIERYVELERARFGDGLQFSLSLPKEAEKVIVPPLILQPLVENAIRHGSQNSQVTVHIDVQLTDHTLNIYVLDDGPGPPINPMPIGRSFRDRRPSLGLKNVDERLKRYYHGRAGLSLTARDGVPGASALIELPLLESPRRRSRIRRALGDLATP